MVGHVYGCAVGSVGACKRNETLRAQSSFEERRWSGDGLEALNEESPVHTEMILLLMLAATPLLTSAAGAQVICADQPSLKQTRLCFDLNKGRFVDPHIGRNAIYDVESELKQREVSLGGNRRKARACKGFNFYRRCMKKYSTEADRLECRYARCSVCIAESFRPHCPFCFADKSVFCPAVEACSCPWKAGFGLWESCRDKISNLCSESNTTTVKRKLRRKKKKNYKTV
uniref:Uncharacterized protein n=1 Tax=Parascaris univalens TaxID=6257 RepID=A0A915BAQ4_PARUN